MSKDIQRVKRQPMKWEKIFANNIFDNIDIQNIKRTTNQQQQQKQTIYLKTGKILEQTFL